MTISPATFDHNIAVWTEGQRSLWSQLKYTVVHANLRQHLGIGPLRVLDAGGGNGFDAIPLAKEGHSVVIADYSDEMLAAATRYAAAAGVQDRVTVQHAELSALPTLFPSPSFDLVLCHNVLQYVDDIQALLAALLAPLKTNGLLSLIGLNRYAIPYVAGFLYGNLEEAFATIDTHTEAARIFGVTMHEYTGEEIIALLSQAGCAVDEHYGIRCLCDYWGDNERKSDPATFAQIEKLELALTDKHPYKLLARYFQIIAHKLP